MPYNAPEYFRRVSLYRVTSTKVCHSLEIFLKLAYINQVKWCCARLQTEMKRIWGVAKQSLRKALLVSTKTLYWPAECLMLLCAAENNRYLGTTRRWRHKNIALYAGIVHRCILSHCVLWKLIEPPRIHGCSLSRRCTQSIKGVR